MIYTIYKLTNHNTGKTYTGCTSRPIEQREKEHFRTMQKGNHSNPLLQIDFDMGHRFSFEIIKCVEGKQAAIAEELKNTDANAYSKEGRPIYNPSLMKHLIKAA